MSCTTEHQDIYLMQFWLRRNKAGFRRRQIFLSSPSHSCCWDLRPVLKSWVVQSIVADSWPLQSSPFPLEHDQVAASPPLDLVAMGRGMLPGEERASATWPSSNPAKLCLCPETIFSDPRYAVGTASFAGALLLRRHALLVLVIIPAVGTFGSVWAGRGENGTKGLRFTAFGLSSAAMSTGCSRHLLKVLSCASCRAPAWSFEGLVAALGSAGKVKLFLFPLLWSSPFWSSKGAATFEMATSSQCLSRGIASTGFAAVVDIAWCLRPCSGIGSRPATPWQSLFPLACYEKAPCTCLAILDEVIDGNVLSAI